MQIIMQSSIAKEVSFLIHNIAYKKKEIFLDNFFHIRIFYLNDESRFLHNSLKYRNFNFNKTRPYLWGNILKIYANYYTIFFSLFRENIFLKFKINVCNNATKFLIYKIFLCFTLNLDCLNNIEKILEKLKILFLKCCW